MPIANVELTNTYDEWRVRTNSLIVQGDQILLAINSNLYPRTNTIMINANTSYNVANLGFVHSNNAFLQANTGRNHANLAFNQGNIAFTQASTARDNANAAFALANSGFIQANTARVHANTAHESANAGLSQANTARIHANVSFDQANTARIHANVSFDQANTARVHANASFTAANTKLTNASVTLVGTLTLTGNVNTQRVFAANGAVNDIAYTFQYFPYMGMYAISANTLGLATANTLRMQIDTAGRITGGGTAGSNGFNGYGDRFISLSAPSGGSDGDIWYKVE